MKIQKAKSKKPLIITVVMLILAVIGGGAYYWFVVREDPGPSTSSINLSPPTDAEKAAGSQAKASTVNPDTNPSSSKDANSQSPPPASTVVIELTTQSPYKANGSSYQIRALIQGVVDGSTCTLTLTKGSKTVTKTAPTQASAQSSTCEGFDIPVSELSTGSWQLKLTLTGNGHSGSISETIQVQ